MKEKLKELVKRMWRGEGFPEEIITPIHKKGAFKLSDTSNYRDVTLLCSAYKLYAAMLAERLGKETEKKSVPKL